MANIITGVRIVCSIALLFSPVFSPVFYAFYIVAGLSDMIDGTVARKTGTVSEFGSKLDTAADLVLVLVCLLRFIPVIPVPTWLVIWIGLIAVIKAINLVSGYVTRKEIVVLHTAMNKLTGVLLFVLPLTFSFIDLRYSGAFVSAAATFAAVQEGHMLYRGFPQRTCVWNLRSQRLRK
ncbi:MAG: CDP-alcohol phosphatidyltransferase family protein [Oscillospiraceae bacterium]|nr:CDP-alcohol phosphatidyltransferase family protein [Oscillospiraceae bacterium]